MRTALERFTTAVRIAVVSSNQVTNIPTAIVAFLLKPILEVVLLASFVHLAEGPVALTMCAGILVSIITSICGGVAGSIAGDRLRGVLLEYLTFERGLGVFWASRMALPVTAATAVALIALVGIRLAGVITTELFTRSMMLLLPALVVGCLLAMFIGSLAALGKDPYLGSDLLGTALPILVGVVVPISAFPAVLEFVARCLPGSGLIMVLRGSADWLPLLLDVGVAAALALLGLGALRLAVRALRSGSRAEVF